MGQDELIAIQDLIDEKLLFKTKIRDHESYIKFGEAILGVSLPRDVRPAYPGPSFRSLMQFAALKKFIPAKDFEQVPDLLGQIMHKESREEIDVLFKLFSRLFESANPEQLKVLYQEYLPANLILERVQEKLVRATSVKEVASTVQSLISELTKSRSIDAGKYFDSLVELASSLQ